MGTLNRPMEAYGGFVQVVDRKSTDDLGTMRSLRRFSSISSSSADYHQQYLATNPNGYCGIGRCGVPFKIADLQLGEQA